MKNNKPSSTARLIARSIICLGYQGSDLVTTKYLGFIKACCGHFEKGKDLIVFLSRFRFSRSLFLFLINQIIPGLVYHYAIRKREIQNLCIREISRNKIEQIVIFGVGFDSISFDMRDRFKDIVIYEYDHPATQKVRNKATFDTRLSMDRINSFPLNLNENKLFLKELDKSKKTLVLAEGLLMYLAKEEVRSFIQNLKKSFDQPFHLVFTFIDSSSSGKPDFYKESPIVEAYLKWKNEPFRWGIKSNDIDEFLILNGMDFKELIVPSEFMIDYIKNYSMDHEIRERIAYAISK